ncbi:hypothetical protein MRX96_002541 [Rhipicephalus microplus]
MRRRELVGGVLLAAASLPPTEREGFAALRKHQSWHARQLHLHRLHLDAAIRRPSRASSPQSDHLRAD